MQAALGAGGARRWRWTWVQRAQGCSGGAAGASCRDEACTQQRQRQPIGLKGAGGKPCRRRAAASGGRGRRQPVPERFWLHCRCRQRRRRAWAGHGLRASSQPTWPPAAACRSRDRCCAPGSRRATRQQCQHQRQGAGVAEGHRGGAVPPAALAGCCPANYAAMRQQRALLCSRALGRSLGALALHSPRAGPLAACLAGGGAMSELQALSRRAGMRASQPPPLPAACMAAAAAPPTRIPAALPAAVCCARMLRCCAVSGWLACRRTAGRLCQRRPPPAACGIVAGHHREAEKPAGPDLVIVRHPLSSVAYKCRPPPRAGVAAQQAATGAGAAPPACPCGCCCCCCCISACTSAWNSRRMQRTNALKLPPPLSCASSGCRPATCGSHACTAGQQEAAGGRSGSRGAGHAPAAAAMHAHSQAHHQLHTRPPAVPRHSLATHATHQSTGCPPPLAPQTGRGGRGPVGPAAGRGGVGGASGMACSSPASLMMCSGSSWGASFQMHCCASERPEKRSSRAATGGRLRMHGCTHCQPHSPA